nr:ester cyclase [Paraburkholderia heleia]
MPRECHGKKRVSARFAARYRLFQAERAAAARTSRRMTGFRAALPDLSFRGTADLIAEGEYVVGQWERGGTHSGPVFGDFLAGSLPAASGRKMHFAGTTVLRLKRGRFVEGIGLDNGVTALTQLGLIWRV